MNRIQLVASPFYGEPDFSRLADAGACGRLDAVSLADLLRNGFVYPPFSIYENVRLVSCGFDPAQDMFGDPVYRPLFAQSMPRPAPSGSGRAPQAPARDWAGEYHRLLRDAVAAASERMASPWLLQSGGKDSTSLAIAASEARPDTVCVTYLGGLEEDEVASARQVAQGLGLRHEALVCDPGRAYDRYLALLPRMPLLTADFALLSYADLATEIVRQGGDGVLDGLGSDVYLGVPPTWHKRMLRLLARGVRLPRFVDDAPWLGRSFELSYLLATLRMHPYERGFPGSRFSDTEVDALFGRCVAQQSRARLARFAPAMAAAGGLTEQLSITLDIMACPGGMAKGLYTAAALSLRVAYPYCDPRLWHWITREVPPEQRMDARRGINKVLVREHIARRFPRLPYVLAKKGSFRFDLRGLARQRYDQVYAYAERVRDVLPGAPAWLARHRKRLDNKYDASKFYLLAVTLPWVDRHARGCRMVPESAREANPPRLAEEGAQGVPA
ncbi:asparagine synthase-related protein [Vulcaniibacterium tengchongense]|uniref:Asparagine synthase n=1 Tax=Vulcaniibacterium tengchongense TaxID=1273429 RepID=A0A3N4VX35_9GAMM|nr:asparagine synthase-related protein [Vulcaniibacterium tengchongense]RPE81667.1 asparagine synthase [Vulcaniibacterium tengchongense]